MNQHHIGRAIGLSMVCLLLPTQVQALPGQTTEEVAAWIRANPTLQPAPGERLLVRKSDTPARRFTFQALLQPPGKTALMAGSRRVRSEEFSLFDMIDGVSLGRLRESLRVIYGVTIYQDYLQAAIVYSYPTQATLNQSVNQSQPLLAALQGELRRGEYYAYWLEVVRRPDGFAYTGKATVFLISDLPKLEAELRNR